MSHTTKSDDGEARLRRQAVQMFRVGQLADAIAKRLRRSRRWVYHWVAYQRAHPHTRYRSRSRAPQHRPTRVSRQMVYRILRLRRALERHCPARFRYAAIGARTIRRELEKRRPKACPSLSTIQRVLSRHHLTHPPVAEDSHAYRPHPLATYPNAVQATDIITRWLTGGEVVQTFTTVDHYTNAAFASPQPHKRTQAARTHLLKTWEILGIPDLAQFDNESAFRGGRHPHQLGPIVRLCLYVGAAVLFTPEYEADYNWVVETFNRLWAKRCWQRHHFTSRARVRPAIGRFLAWYDREYVAPRQAGPPRQLRRGHRRFRLSPGLAAHIPDDLPICKGQVHAVRKVSADGRVTFLNEPFGVGKRYHDRYVWVTLNTAKHTLTVYYQADPEAEWQTLKVYVYPLDEPVRPVPKPFARLHA